MSLCTQNSSIEEATTVYNNQQVVVDDGFEPQGRPRSCTWPCNRLNAEDESDEKVLNIEPTIVEDPGEEALEQADSLEQQISTSYLDSMKHNGQYAFKEPQAGTSSYQNSVDTSNNLASDFSGIVLSTNTIQLPAAVSFQKPMVHTTIDIASTVKPERSMPLEAFNSNATKPKVMPTHNKVCSTSSNPTTGSLTTATKPKASSRKNAWGNMSYADLITTAITSVPEKRLTLAQIYDWMVKNVAYFKDKGDSNSSAGWKNSIRHNLSLHSKFLRTQNEGTGKSSWWTINKDAKPGKPHRRRASSMDPPKNNVSKRKLLENKKKGEQGRKPNQSGGAAKTNVKPSDTITSWSPRGEDGGDFESGLSRFEYRQRTNSSASSIGPLSPTRSNSFYMPKDTYDDEGNLNENPVTWSIVHAIKKSGSDEYLDDSDIQPAAKNRYQPLGYGGTYDSCDTVPGLEQTPNLARLLTQPTKSTSSGVHSNKPSVSGIRAKMSKPNPLDTSRPRSRANTMPRLQPQPKYDMTSPPQNKNNNMTLESPTRCSPMSYINLNHQSVRDTSQNHHQHQQQQQQPNLLYNLLNSSTASSQGGVGNSNHVQDSVFTSSRHGNGGGMMQQTKQQQQITSNHQQQFTPNYTYENTMDSRLSSSYQPTTTFASNLPSLQQFCRSGSESLSDKVINDANLSQAHPPHMTTGSGAGAPEMEMHQAAGGVEDFVLDELNLFEASNSLEMAEADMSLLISEQVNTGPVDPADLNQYFGSDATTTMTERMEMDSSSPADFGYGLSSMSPMQSSHHQQTPQQQYQTLQPSNNEQFATQQPQYQSPQYQTLQVHQMQPPPAQQQQGQQHIQMQHQQQQISNIQQQQQQQIMGNFIGSTQQQQQQPSGGMMQTHLMPSYDDSISYNGSVGGPPDSSRNHYNFQQQCYGQMVPQHLMMSAGPQAAAPISSSTNYKT